MRTSRWRYYLPRTTAQQAWSVLSVNWPLGFTSFGGPPVHFKIVSLVTFQASTYPANVQLPWQFHDRFCERQKWISEQLVSTNLPQLSSKKGYD